MVQAGSGDEVPPRVCGSWVRTGSDEAAGSRVDDQLGAIAGRQLLHDIAEISLDCVDRQIELYTDLIVGITRGH